MRATLKWGFLAAALLAAVLSVGLLMQQPWAVQAGPWRDSRLGNIFAASIAAAVALPLGWIGVSGHFGSTAPGFLHLGVMCAGLSAVAFGIDAGPADAYAVLRPLAVVLVLAAAGCAAAASWAHRLPAPDPRPLPVALRGWCGLYILILIPAGVAMLNGVPGIMPWPVQPVASRVYGWVLLAAVCSFLYPLLRPQVGYVTVGLWGFLAYDAVLLGPFMRHFDTVRPELRNTLTAYTAVLVLNAAVSLWYLLVAPATRVIGRVTALPTQSPPGASAHRGPASHGPNAASP